MPINPERRVKHKNVEEKTFEALKDMILVQELKPGERIIQEFLAANLGVSRTPVKKALTKLAELGLVTVKPKGWIYVRRFSKKEILAIYDVREMLEGLSARLAAEKINKKDIKKMREMFISLKESQSKSFSKLYVAADLKFHEFLAQKSGNDVLWKIIRGFGIQIAAFEPGVFRSPKDTLKDHLEIIDALADHNGELAETLMRAHIRATREKIANS
ncbi:MAG: GntR family transcriptional regulator [Candidatus Aerophobetes bacterium]|nr:GntR family transcriptional regulator [Candidatus Aerophobetes bacterium]